MNADDKKLLRKFITQRADRTKSALQRVHNRNVEAVKANLPFASCTSEQQIAVSNYNRALILLAENINELRRLSLDAGGDSFNRGYYFNPTKKETTIATSDSFNVSPIKIERGAPRLESAIAKDIEVLDREHATVIKTLDIAVDDALMDLLSADLPGIRETLARLGQTFDTIATAAGAIPTDLID